MSFADYRALDAVNWSSLRHIDTSPAHYRAALEHPRESTPAMDVGTAFHLAALEPERWDEQIAIWEGGRRYGKTWDAFCAEHAARTILKPEEAADARAAAEAVRAHPTASDLLAEGRPEVTIQWEDPTTGIACKGRLDWLHVGPDTVTLVDLKKSRDIDPRAFARAAVQYGYHGQLGFYTTGLRTLYPHHRIEAYIIAAEATPPYDVVVYDLRDALPHGVAYAMRLLDTLAGCRWDDEWPGRSGVPVMLDLPPWGREDDLRGAA